MELKKMYVPLMFACLATLAIMGQWQILSITLAILLVNLYWTAQDMNDHVTYHIKALHMRVRALEQERLRRDINTDRLPIDRNPTE